MGNTSELKISKIIHLTLFTNITDLNFIINKDTEMSCFLEQNSFNLNSVSCLLSLIKTPKQLQQSPNHYNVKLYMNRGKYV